MEPGTIAAGLFKVRGFDAKRMPCLSLRYVHLSGLLFLIVLISGIIEPSYVFRRKH